MAFNDNIRGIYQKELGDIRSAGIFKEERIICSPQDSEIDVQFPAGAAEKRVINMCANNYLGLSSHPDVVEAARRGLDHRGYGMSSVRFICGTQDIHKELEGKLTARGSTTAATACHRCASSAAPRTSTRSWKPS